MRHPCDNKAGTGKRFLITFFKLSVDRTGRISPRRLFATVAFGIFLAEVVAMIVVYFIPPVPYYWIILIDAAIMLILVFPFLYFFSVRSMFQHIEMRRMAEQALQQKEQLQQRFFDSIDVLK